MLPPYPPADRHHLISDHLAQRCSRLPVLASKLDISLHNQQGQGATRMAVGILLFAECEELWAKPARK